MPGLTSSSINISSIPESVEFEYKYRSISRFTNENNKLSLVASGAAQDGQPSERLPAGSQEARMSGDALSSL
jgi:hypothetical protein